MHYHIHKGTFEWWQSYLVPVSNLSFPELSTPRFKTQVGKAGVYKELVMLELLLRNSSWNCRGSQVFDILVC